MIKNLFFSALFLGLCLNQVAQNQSKEPKKHNPEVFDEEAALAKAKAKGIKASEIKGYVQFLKQDFYSQKGLEKQSHKHSPYEGGVTGDIQETVIYLTPNGNKTASVGCPNMGFEQYNFSGWTGGIGTTNTGGSLPNYTSTGSTIINTAGNNVSQLNTINYHTIMTLPAVNANYLTANGYDTLACKAVGTQTICQIPYVSPFSFDPVSVRMNGAVANNRGCRLKYITTSSSTNQRLSFSYAVVLQNPSGHLAGESPYFKVEVKNESTGTILPGCTSYTFNPKSTVPSDSLFQSAIGSTFDPTFYRKWQFYSVDLSTLPAGTSVSINFEVGGCTLGGHWGYAYVDAECGGIGTPYANMCSGSTFATLVAPTGFSSYQWLTVPGNTPIAGATNDTLIINSATPGSVYAVQMVSPGGCTLTLNDTIKLTTVNIINLNANSSCAGGASGSTYVQANGSSGVYTYTWTNTGTGAVVGNSQIATGLAPGNYSVVVASTTCGQASANISVGVSPPFFSTQTKSYCGNYTFIKPPSVGTGYVWYGATAPSTVVTQISTNDTLFINTPVVGGIYTLVYNNSFGCKDSIKYTLSLVPGGNTYLSNINNVCPGNTNGSAVFNISSSLPAPYTYSVTGPSGTVVSNTTISTSTVLISPLSPGTYSVASYDGICFYNSTFTISPIQTNFTVTPTNSVICYPNPATLNLNFGAGVPTSCGVDPSVCSGPLTTLFNTGPFVSNSSSNYPTPFSGWWYSGKHQFLVRAAELNAAGIFAGKISSLSFNITALNTSPLIYPDYSIKMGCTNLTTLPTGSGNSFLTGLTQVYFNPNQSISLGWLTHNFTQSYVWDGTSNIIIEVCTGGLTSFPANASIELKQMPYVTNMKSISYSSGVSSCPDVTNNGNGTYMTNGANLLPNMKFGYCSASASPSTYTVILASSSGSITTNYANDSIRVIPPTTFTPSLLNTPYVYTLTVTNPVGGCTKTQTVAILYPSAQTSITTSSNFTVCEGTPVNLSANGAATYTWSYSVGGTSTQIATSSSISVTPPATGINSYIVTGSNTPCPSTPQTKTITVNVTPKADLIISPLQDVTKCLNKPFVINTGVNSITPGNTGAPYTYSWTTLPGSAPAPGNNSSSTYTANSNGTTTLVLTVNGVCANATKDTIVIKNFTDNLALSILDTSTTCANTNYTLRSAAVGGYPNYNFNWFLMPDFTTAVSNSQNLTAISPANQGTYTLAVVVSDSCGYQRTAYEVITVLPPCSVIIPNIITPNGDGVNDFFKIANIEHHPNTTLTVFDRWGKKVYENTNYNNEWKAEGSSDGTFFYIVDVPDDKKYNGFITVFHGK